MKDKLFALVDCDNFFVSCERVFRPDLWKKPVVVLSNNDGCIISRSREAKLAGIPMGAPLHEVEDLVKQHRITYFSANFLLYGDISQRIVAILERFSPDVEVYSIDECFVELTGFAHLDVEAYCKQIRQTILQWVGIPVSIGIASSKTLAKIAAERAKKSDKYEGVFMLKEEEREDFLKQTPIGDVWGVGYRTKEKLITYGIETALDMSKAKESWIKKMMSVVGHRTQLELQGKSCLTIEECPSEKKNIMFTRGFGKGVTSLAEIEEAIAAYTATATMKLRRQQSQARVITVYITTNRFVAKDLQYRESKSIALPVPTDFTPMLTAYAMKVLREIFREGYVYHKVGVFLSELSPKAQQQTFLFEKDDTEKHSKINELIDKLNKSAGGRKIFFAKEGVEQHWKSKSEHRSPGYTTNWDELPEVV